MPTPTFEQKVTIPPPPAIVVARPRLTRLLDGAVERPVTVVHGPPGCGKTEAVAAWARASPRRPAWATLDRSDRDPVRLAGTLHACLAPHVEVAAPGPVAPRTPDEAEAVLVELLARAARADEPLTLVIDDAVALRDSPAGELLLSLLRYLPDALHVVVIAGGRATLAMGRLRVAGRLAEIDRHELALGPDETATFVAAVSGRDGPDGAAAEVHDLTEGHPSFVAAAARALADGGLDDAGWVHTVVGESLDLLPPELRRLVEEVAPLRVVTPALADAITARGGSAALLAELARETPLVVPLGQDDGAFRLHPLARRALVGRLRAEDPERLAAVHRAAARWRERHGDPHGAIEEWIAAGEHDAAWALVARHRAETFYAGGREIIEGWIDALHPVKRPHDPRRAADVAITLVMAGRLDEAARWADEAASPAAAAGEGGDIGDLIRFVRSLCRYGWGDLDGVLAAQADVDVDAVALPHPHMATAVVRVESLVQLGRFDEARRTLLEMPPTALLSPSAAQVTLPGVQASLAAREGRLSESLALAHQGLESARRLEGREPPGTAYCHSAIGLVLLEQGHVVDALLSLDTADTAARRAGLAHVVVRVATARARARSVQGRRAEAFDAVEQARRPIHVHPLPDRLQRWLALAESRLHLGAGDGDEALTILDGLDGVGAPDPEQVVLQAWAALETGDRARAQDLLAADLGPASLGTRIEADLVRMRCVRNPEQIRRHLAHAVHRGATDGYLTVFLEHRDGVVDALHDLRAVEPSPYLTDLLFLLDAGEGVRLAEALTERELGVLAALQSSRSIEAIAGDLDVSINTLKTHIKAVYRKLDAGNRADAVRRALVLRLIGPTAAGGETLSRGAGAP